MSKAEQGELETVVVEEVIQPGVINEAPKGFALKRHLLKGFLGSKKGKIIAISASVVPVVAILLTVPMTRYATLGLVVKKDVAVTVIDVITEQPISDAQVSLGGVSAQTDSKGDAQLKSVSVGEYDLKIVKKYYRDYSQGYTVPVIAGPAHVSASVQATGRQVVLSVANRIGGGSLADATIKISGTAATTDESGKINIVLPAEPKLQKGTITRSGYNTEDIEVHIDDTDRNGYALTPSGSLFYLSKLTGKINVMKSHLDGTSSTVVLEGTGSESDSSTVLLAARDWRYVALAAKRDSDKDKLYLIDTQTGALTTIDEGADSYQLVGWSGHNFIYTLFRKTTNDWDDKKQALKSFNSETGKITLVDETVGQGTNSYDYQYERIENAYILKDELVYTKSWNRGSQYVYQPSDKNMLLLSVNPVSGSKKSIKQFPQAIYGNIQARLYEPQGLYVRTNDGNSITAYFEYENGAILSVTATDDSKFFGGEYATYLISPSGKKTFWFESRDGKNTLLIGDDAGLNSKQIAALSEYIPYGWYSDDYILFSRNGSELYIASASEPLSDANQPVKVTNYHKPRLNYAGYGYGYGGL